MKDSQRKILLDISRRAIELYLEIGKKLSPYHEDFDDVDLWERRGTFVTLTIGRELRGCIGSIIPTKPLILDIVDNSINAAFRDPRFYPLTKDEFKAIDIEISILTIPMRLEFSDVQDLYNKIRPGIDGVILRRGIYQATFLPQVWEDLPSKDEFFGNLCYKAGLPYNCIGLKGMEINTYQVEAFSEKDFRK
ncbi:MAG: AmmeMemoRadiSam system protein A [Caldiserica bacterium]|nr:AmmeMemoRadiSam system protein A [Caldisericota bacterium]PIX28734.1 MAG: AmmeMemoRadiSam system protein A [Caldiserica bacterium CG_4_8_14_3_um_filter_35_18]